ncbi:putative membrane protein [Methanophagales archaeon]|nr:putative membrane protein [Methanophagales archaeon]
MQTRKEKLIEFVKSIRDAVHDEWVRFEFSHLRIARLIVYSMCLVVVVSICFYLFRYFNLFHTDVNSARYMLSALVQSQAAIVAIVITLTLIAVQLTASAYSPRVIDIFKKNPDMWILLGCYGVSIFYGFIVLKRVVGADGDVVSQSAIWSIGPISISFEFYVSLAYWLGAFTFVVLFPYLLNIVGLLKPENVIKRLAIEITKDKILNSKEDPVQPIMDIIHASIMKYDLETTRIGLKTVTVQVPEIIFADDEKKISRYFCDHLTRVGRVAISREDEESTLVVIENFKNFAKSTAEKGLKTATMLAARSLGKVGKAAAGKGLEHATTVAAWSLGEVRKAATEKELEDATNQAVFSLGEVGKAAAENGLEDATMQAVSSLGWAGKATAEKELEDATKLAAMSLGKVGEAAAEKELEDATKLAAMSLGDVGEAAAENGLGVATREAAKSLGRVGKGAAGKGLEHATKRAARSLAELTILSEELVKAVIQDYELKEEQDQVSFQKFIKIYEQELKELRAKKN